MGVGQKWARVPDCKRQPPRRALLLCQMGVSLLAQARGFPQGCWDPRGLGEPRHLLHVWAVSWLRLGVLALALSCAFTEGVGRAGSHILPGNPLMAMFLTQPPQDSHPPGAPSAQDEVLAL